MTTSFNGQEGLIVVVAKVEGPLGTVELRLAVDTAATDTAARAALLRNAGYDPAAATERVEITFGTAVEPIPVLTVARLTALGRERTGFPILAHTFPPSAGVDGVLGLDFLRGGVLTIDFRSGQITLT
jgi:hypothetical protein